MKCILQEQIKTLKETNTKIAYLYNASHVKRLNIIHMIQKRSIKQIFILTESAFLTEHYHNLYHSCTLLWISSKQMEVFRQLFLHTDM